MPEGSAGIHLTPIPKDNLNGIADGKMPPGVAGHMACWLETEMINQAESLGNRL